MKEADSEKEATMEAELRAARERAIVPLEARMTQFKEMLLERGVSTKDVASLVVQRAEAFIMQRRFYRFWGNVLKYTYQGFVM